MIQKQFHIIAETGIHARPATLLVQAAGKFACDIQIIHKEKQANLKSIMGVLSLSAHKHAEVTISCDGEDEEDAIAMLEATMKKEGLIA